MDWNDTPEQAAFRSQVSTLIEDRLPDRYRDLAARGSMPERAWENDRKSSDPIEYAAAIDWHSALAERHWVAPHWPAEYGGGGLSPMEQFIFNQEIAEAGAPAVGGSGVHMLGPTLIVHGSDEQKEKYLPPILDGEVTWAQGYSEPGSGSDLASLTTRAVRDGDDFIINGQKIWTSAAHTADAMFALVRTDPDAPKHRGISFVMIDDIKTPGITVRPLININGDHYFNEVFFEDVRIPANNLVGELNRGWYVGMTLRDFERSNIGGAVAARRQLHQLITHIQNNDQGARERVTPELRQEIVDRYVETETLYQFSFRIISMQSAGLVPNYEASTAKLFASELSQRLALTATKVFGLHAQHWSDSPPAS
ncbi:MAG: hypothetical protein F4Y04_01630, partial [Chloroflexi bacterium]|nr:hypothetical protein [Chloroflexota bacterium]